MQRAAALGYNGVELNIRDPLDIDSDILIKNLRSNRLEVVALGTGQAYVQEGLSFADANADVRNQVVKRIKAHIQLAQILNAQVVIGGIRGKFNFTDESDRQPLYENALKSIKECATFADEHGVTITIEPINRYETNFINTLEEGLTFLKDLGNDRVRLLADTFHMNIEEASFINSLKLAGNKLSHIHLVDSNRLSPGQGHIDFHSIIRTLSETGYDSYISAEVLPKPDDETAAQQNIEYVKKILAEID